MKRLFLATLALTLPLGNLHADGFPFDIETHEVIGANLRLPLTQLQQTEVAALGHIRFTDEQLGWLRLVYPKIPARLRVIASTYNDNLEERPPNPVDCIWTKPDEVSLTLPRKWREEDYSFDEGFDDIGKAVDWNVTFADIRIAPSGKLYHRGLEITLDKAVDVIRSIRKADGSPASQTACVLITLPPPYRSADEDQIARNKAVEVVFAALVEHGKRADVNVQQIW